MRKIKFKFWDTTEKQFVSDPVIHGEGSISVMDGIAGTDYCKDIIPLQYTGLTDIDNKEIYEGDIVQAHPGEKFTVGFEDGSFIIYFRENGDYNTLARSLINAWKLTVVGNKFQV